MMSRRITVTNGHNAIYKGEFLAKPWRHQELAACVYIYPGGACSIVLEKHARKHGHHNRS